jgi:hypothetical protein
MPYDDWDDYVGDDEEDGNDLDPERILFIKERRQQLATPEEEAEAEQIALDEDFKRYRQRMLPVAGGGLPIGGFESGEEEPKIYRVAGRPGGRGTIRGRNLFSVTGVVVGGAPADDVTIVSSEQIDFAIPPGAESGAVKVAWDTGRGYGDGDVPDLYLAEVKQADGDYEEPQEE